MLLLYPYLVAINGKIESINAKYFSLNFYIYHKYNPNSIMKKLLITLSLALICQLGISQETYNYNNESLSLKTEIEGTLDFLWTSGNDGRFRYFVKDSNEKITELENTKTGKTYNSEYTSTLEKLTGQDASKTRFTMYGIRSFVSDYNKTQDENFVTDEPSELVAKLGLFGGLSNNPFIENPDNKFLNYAAAEFEVSDKANKSRHAGFANLRYTFSSGSVDYTALQLALGYRFKFVNTDKIKVFVQNKFATITYSKTKEFDANTNSIKDSSGTTFDAPLIFGLGADFKVSDHGNITLVYDSLFSAIFKDNSNFPLDFAIGYKFNL